MVNKKREYPERAMQAAFMEWLGYKHPNIFKTTFSVPNEAKRSVFERCALKRAGLKAGVPDIFVAYPVEDEEGKIHACGLFIEFKTKYGQITKAQEDMRYYLSKNGYICYVCRTLDEAISAVTSYLVYDKHMFRLENCVEYENVRRLEELEEMEND